MIALVVRFALAGLIAGYMGRHGLRKKSLSVDGAVAAVAVGFIGLSVGYRWGTLLLFFYGTSSYLTKKWAAVKRKVELDFKEGGQRNAMQVLCNSGFASILALMFAWETSGADFVIDMESRSWTSLLCLAYVSFYGCCAGDTWASEIGVAFAMPSAASTPAWRRTYSVMSCCTRKVPRGVNGGVSVIGTLASVAGGLAIGLWWYTMGFLFASGGSESSCVILVGVLAGFIGSMLDSVLGATIQKSISKEDSSFTQGIDLLSNEQVNLVSAIATSVFLPPLCVLVGIV